MNVRIRRHGLLCTHKQDGARTGDRMARLEELNFGAFVEKRREATRFAGEVDEPGSHAYAYLSDRTTRKTFERIKPCLLYTSDAADE